MSLPPEVVSILIVGFNEMNMIEQKECISAGMGYLPSVSSLNTLTLILSDGTSTPRLITTTLNLLRRILPYLIDFDYVALYTQIVNAKVIEADYTQLVAYEKIMTLIVLADKFENDFQIKIYSKVVDSYNDVLRMMHAPINEYLLDHLKRKFASSSSDSVFHFIVNLLMNGKMKITLLRFLLQNVMEITRENSIVLFPPLFSLITSFNTEKDFIAAEYAHQILTNLLIKYKEQTKAEFQTYLFLMFSTILTLFVALVVL
ncbi:hypothetical protein EIN_165260 [Entamoeba invadens IP1]|uniref:Uncharacterized protein n=1 Tax=Entamoeba invadens IP1 TaxID=370355 RepID=A0A0A1U7N9_ENTIV|nr:hypothetical protein EIN_165260 [Entamoeba invadens IP1]ELP89066.1 hypothetical protein EIN_165260 [Entamoeba invadens IP1]|eukprot:XP_004255837.1 hypothetical protein EIN_165260 [Entamoeba invadens IP1]